MKINEKRKFLSSVDLTKIKFYAKISDFGLSTIFDDTSSQLSICGTPLYSSPQLLKKRVYSYKVDIWALGIMCYELLMGRTPFHSYKMQDLIEKINAGKYVLSTKEPISIECALFLSQCLQANESDRIDDKELLEHPFLKSAMEYDQNEQHGGDLKLTVLDQTAFMEEIFRATVMNNSTARQEVLVTDVSKESFLSQNKSIMQKNELVLSTQEQAQTDILKRQLHKNKNLNKKLPRLPLEETVTSEQPDEDSVLILLPHQTENGDEGIK